MRTTLDLDPVVLSAARAKALAERISLGKAVSDLARIGLDRVHSDSSGSESAQQSGFPVLRGTPGHPVTDEVVAAFRDDDPARGLGAA